MDGWMDGCRNGGIERWMDGWTDADGGIERWMDGWMDGWMDDRITTVVTSHIVFSSTGGV